MAFRCTSLALILALTGYTPVLGKRIKITQHATHVDSKCSPKSCSTFDESASCSCAPHIGTAALQERLKGTIYDVVQRVRKVLDKLTPESGTFSKLWWGGKLGDAQKELALLEESLEKEPEIQKLFETPVKQLSSEGFEAPAGTWPLMVEIWDDNIAVRRQVFIGEVGVPFKDGENHYDLPLQYNSRQWAVKPAGATISFSTIVEKSSPYDCDFEGRKTRCVKFNVKVVCHSASNLPNTDTGILGDVTDAYFKVRVQTKTGEASLKLKTEPIDNNLNPTFEATLEVPPFEQPLIDPVPTSTAPDLSELDETSLVPFTIDEMTLSEQLTTHMYHLGTSVFLNSDKCKAEDTKVPAFCRLLEKMGSFTVDKSALEELAATEEDPVAKKVAVRLAEASKAESLAEVGELTTSFVETDLGPAGSMAAVMAGRRAARRRGGGGGGRSSYHGGGGGGGAGLFFLGLIIFIIIICSA